MAGLSLAGPFLIILIVVILVIIGVYCLYLYNLQKTLMEVSEENRDVVPGYAWLLLIPYFGYYYGFVFYQKLSSSLEKEYQSRGLSHSGDYGKQLGLIFASTLAASFVLGFVPALQMISSILSLGILVIWIIYWVKIAQFKNELMSSPKGEGGFSMNDSDLLDR